MEFASEPGFDLALKSLESRRARIKLLNVRKDGPGDEKTTRATVFVPQEKRTHFLKKAIAYATKDNPPKKDGTTTPQNATLIESIGDVRAAMLETSFWQDSAERLPGDSPDWVEVWLSSEDLGDIESFEMLCHERNIQIGQGRLSFPERTVLLILAIRSQLEDLIERSDIIAEFRAGREVATFFIEEQNKDQIEWVDELLEHSEFRDNDQVAVLVLDHGVNNGHRLLEPVLHDDDCHAVEEEWRTQDDHGHGTLMAGTVAYGDLLDSLLNNRVNIVRHTVESVKILPPPPEENPKRLWAHYTARGISLAEIKAPERVRIICMAVNSDGEPSRGRPTSWSGQIDELASGYSDDKRRLIILSGGNIKDPKDWKIFPESNLSCEVQDPAQAWNALAIGAFTNKTRITDPTLTSYQPIAEA
ncbi:MAG: S8 family serine peptidase, partial [Desulfobulbaceae bacterium]|nr:S8 family serine peptidase [Desulfobulbaceae bacterium]